MRVVLTVLAGAGLLGASALAATDSLLGFRSDSAAAELRREKAFDDLIDPKEMGSWIERMSAEPNQVGSPHDKANADFMLAQFKEWGWDAHLEEFSVLYPTPKSELVELVAPGSYRARLVEPPIPGDANSAHNEGALPPYNIYGADGDVTADLLYANFGMPEDYAELERRGLDAKGKIVIARYGGGWRGLKVKLAQEHGAVGCIIYSDPHEDGYWSGDMYPKGGYRSDDGVQRGSVVDMTLYAGDPLTPGVGSTPGAKRLRLEDAKSLPRIPVIPISSGDARPLLAALGGPVAPPGWRGALPFTYHLGPGPARVHLAVFSDWGQKTIYDVIAVMKGGVYPDEWVIRGNHHDGWVFGAWDPLSGNSAVLAEAKAIGALAKAGWRPKRTLVYAGWDGEEPGLLGSTEWAETHGDELRGKAVLYVNSDTNGRGFLFAGGSHSYQHLLNEAAAAVLDPETGATVLDRWRAHIRASGSEIRNPGTGITQDDQVALKAASAGGDLPIGALGGGSDYTSFLQHLGISALNIGYSGEDEDNAIYHSTYDTFDHYVRFGDPGFAYCAALARTAGRLVLRESEADVLPQRLGDLAETVARYANDIERMAQRERDTAAAVNRLIDEGVFKLAADPQETYAPPPSPADVPLLVFTPLDAAVNRFKRSAKAYDDALAGASAQDFPLSPEALARLNGILQGIEQAFLSERGLPGRGWYRHMLYAPGAYTGYAAKTLPGVREAIELKRWPEAIDYITVVADVVAKATSRIDEATQILNTRSRKAGPSQAPGRGPAPPPPSDS